MSTPLGPCPKCASARTRELGQTSSPPAVAARCDDCGHMWVVALASGTVDAARACPKCGALVQAVGLPTTVARYYRCESCKHLVVVPPR